MDTSPNSAETQDAAEPGVEDADVVVEVDSAIDREGGASSLVPTDSDVNSVVSQDSYAGLITSKEDSIGEDIGDQEGRCKLLCLDIRCASHCI